jgi:hypothetical protein
MCAMQKHLFKALIEIVQSKLLAKFSEAELSPAKDQPKVQAKLFRLGKVNGCDAFVLIQGRNTDNSFTVEFAVSRRGGFPWKADVDFDEDTGLAIARCPVRCRLGFLAPPYKDVWLPTTSVDGPDLDAPEDEMMEYLLLEETADNFPPDLVEASARKVINSIYKYALPFLEQATDSPS